MDTTINNSVPSGWVPVPVVRYVVGRTHPLTLYSWTTYGLSAWVAPTTPPISS
jgi:hypothetical protein